MLVLSRKPGEKILIGDGITVTILAASGHCVRVGIEAPDHVSILRDELVGGQEHAVDRDDTWSRSAANKALSEQSA